MSEIPEPSPRAAEVVPQPAYSQPSSRLYQVAAWVVIVAGIVFIVSAIFWSGAAVARHDYWQHRPAHGWFRPGDSPEAPGPPPGPGHWVWVPGIGPGGPAGPGAPGGPGAPAPPPAPPAAPAPAPPPPPPLPPR